MHHQHYLLCAFYLLLWQNARTSHMDIRNTANRSDVKRSSLFHWLVQKHVDQTMNSLLLLSEYMFWDIYAAQWVILEHGTSSHIGTVLAMNLHWLEKKLGCCSNNFAAFLKKTYSVSSSIMWSLCKTRRCKRMEKSTPDLVADQQSLQGAVHFLLWKTLVAQMCRDPAKICTHPKKHHLAQC